MDRNPILSEITTYTGMHYGGMPESRILAKMEETNMDPSPYDINTNSQSIDSPRSELYNRPNNVAGLYKSVQNSSNPQYQYLAGGIQEAPSGSYGNYSVGSVSSANNGHSVSNMVSIPNLVDRLPVYNSDTIKVLLNGKTLDTVEEDDDIGTTPHEHYNQYARREIVDWDVIPPFFESDKVQRNPNQARERLNKQYNTTRGNSKNLPIHPELFIGFTDADPRGTNDQPNMAKVREQMWGAKTNPYYNAPYDGAVHGEKNPMYRGGRAARLQVPMGNNDDNHVADRPRNGLDYEIGRVQGHIWARDRFKDFTPQHNSQSTNQTTRASWHNTGVRLDNETLRDEFYIDNIIRSEGSMHVNKTPLNQFNSNSFECTPVNTPEQITQNRQHIIAAMVKNSNEYILTDQDAGVSHFGNNTKQGIATDTGAIHQKSAADQAASGSHTGSNTKQGIAADVGAIVQKAAVDQSAGASHTGSNTKQTIAPNLGAIREGVAQEMSCGKSNEAKVTKGLVDADNVGKIYRYSKQDVRIFTPAEIAENRQLAIILKERNNGFDTVKHDQTVKSESEATRNKKMRMTADVRANMNNVEGDNTAGKMYERLTSKMRSGVGDDVVKSKFKNMPDSVQSLLVDKGFVNYKSLVVKDNKLVGKVVGGQSLQDVQTSQMRRRQMLKAVKPADLEEGELKNQKTEDYMVPRQQGGGVTLPKSMRRLQFDSSDTSGADDTREVVDVSMG